VEEAVRTGDVAIQSRIACAIYLSDAARAEQRHFVGPNRVPAVRGIEVRL